MYSTWAVETQRSPNETKPITVAMNAMLAEINPSKNKIESQSGLVWEISSQL
jgi:hypothetical protein